MVAILNVLTGSIEEVIFNNYKKQSDQ